MDSNTAFAILRERFTSTGLPALTDQQFEAFVAVEHEVKRLRTLVEHITAALDKEFETDGLNIPMPLDRRVYLLACAYKSEKESTASYKKCLDNAEKVFRAAQAPFGVHVEFNELPKQVEELFKEVRQFRFDENWLAQAIGNAELGRGTVIARAVKLIERWAAKISERKTVHEWLNQLGIEREENGRQLCLLRRLSILCDAYRFYKTGK